MPPPTDVTTQVRHPSPPPKAATTPVTAAPAIPEIPADMVIKAKEAVNNIVLKVQDTGGQPIFLSILELLTTPEGTIYLVVFSLPKLQQRPSRTRSRQLSDSSSRSSSLQPERRSSWWAHARTR